MSAEASSMLYFAYGSNLHPERLRRRVPSREAIGPALLDGYRLSFAKRGRDGSGKCTLLHADAHADGTVHGVLYRIDVRHRARLDEAEGLGRGYASLSVALRTGERRVRAFTYIAQSEHVDPRLRPFDWYKALVVHGARHHGLDPAWLGFLEAFPADEDTDLERASAHREILLAQASRP